MKPIISTLLVGAVLCAAMSTHALKIPLAPVHANLGVQAQVNATNEAFVLVAPANANPRPAARLMLILVGPAGATQQVFLTQSGSGDLEFENAQPVVAVGAPQVIRLFGKTASNAKNAKKIQVRFTGFDGEVKAEVAVTVIDKVRLVFQGMFQDRLATDPDPSDDKRGVLGHTRALLGEPAFDRVVRFSNPVATRSRCPGFISPKIIMIAAAQPNVEFLTGDAILAQKVNLGTKTYFAGEMHGPGLEPLADFEFKIGTNTFFGKSSMVPKGQGIVAMTAAEMTQFLISPAENFNTKIAGLKDDFNALGAADKLADVGKNIRLRLDVIGDGKFMKQLQTFKVLYPGVIDQNIAINPGDSEVMKLFKNATKFDLEMTFLGWDSDCLMGQVVGSLQIK